MLMKSGDTSPSTIQHLKRSFTEGDNQYEAQFWYARELFLQEHFADASKIFLGLHDRAPGRFRTRAAAPAQDSNGSPIVYAGHIERLEEGYAFLRIVQFPSAIFASRAESDQDEWEGLRSGTSVTSSVAFSRRGARAIKVRAVEWTPSNPAPLRAGIPPDLAAAKYLRIHLLSRSPQAVAQTASHVGTVTGPVSGSTRLASALRLCSSAPRGGALARGV